MSFKAKIKKLSLFEILMGLYFLFKAFFSIYLIVWAFMTSLKTEMDFILHPTALPSVIDNKYWEAMLKFKVTVRGAGTFYLDQLLLNSFITSVIYATISLLSVMSMAYVCAKYPFALSEILVTLVMIVINIPIMGSTGSALLLVKKLGLYDNLLGVSLLKIGFLNMTFLLFYSGFKTVSSEYMEAAFMDGAGHLRTMITIMWPMLSTLAIVTFVNSFIANWDSYNDSLMYLPSLPTAAYGLHLFRTNSKTSSETTFLFTACFIVSIPTFLMFMLFRKKMVGDLGVGGLKG